MWQARPNLQVAAGEQTAQTYVKPCYRQLSARTRHSGEFASASVDSGANSVQRLVGLSGVTAPIRPPNMGHRFAPVSILPLAQDAAFRLRLHFTGVLEGTPFGKTKVISSTVLPSATFFPWCA